ncbi:hypothetical protein LPTSP4_08120 [Leptospira ryugenii]|uniref:Uncharacterized protein n=1 Tax=Leptospira ryugenii TaxID=1917863 RepID=A0A2P2DXE9_9LEPT|nr:hypothetical protein [Leptospira ryugenii]GBF49302.1 hypothetical protein LPTSP4_08120 [Leptospira ryugenii]
MLGKNFLFFSLLTSYLQVQSVFANEVPGFWNESVDWFREEIFLSPNAEEESNLEKRIHEKNQEDLFRLRTTIKSILKQNALWLTTAEKTANTQPQIVERLEGIPNLGGILWLGSQKDVKLRFGDWSAYYEDGLSASKIQNEGQIQSFELDGETIYYFIKYQVGYFPHDFQFIGYKTAFYAFGEDGSLRYTNDPYLEREIRIGEFRKQFESIRAAFASAKELHVGGLEVFLVPKQSGGISYTFFLIRSLLVLWAALLSAQLFRRIFPSLKKQLPVEDLAKE